MEGKIRRSDNLRHVVVTGYVIVVLVTGKEVVILVGIHCCSCIVSPKYRSIPHNSEYIQIVLLV